MFSLFTVSFPYYIQPTKQSRRTEYLQLYKNEFKPLSGNVEREREMEWKLSTHSITVRTKSSDSELQSVDSMAV